MASSVQAYTITITNGNSNVTPADGFVDPLKVQSFGLNFETTPSGLSYDLCKAKRRGNVRYSEIIRQLHLVANVYVDPHSIVCVSTAKTEPTTITFQIYAEHGDASMVTADESNPGAHLSSTDCIKRCVARALVADVFREIDIFDPTSALSTGSFGATQSVPRFGDRIITGFEIAAYAADLATAEGMITVSMI